MLLGGGIRCLAFIGALSAIEEKGINDGKVVVASGDSVVGSLYAMGKMLILLIISQRTLSPPIPKHYTLKKYFQGLLLIQLHAVEREHVKQSKWNDTILIFCGDIPPTKFSLSPDEKIYLFVEGYQQTKKYIEYKWKI